MENKKFVNLHSYYSALTIIALSLFLFFKAIDMKSSIPSFSVESFNKEKELGNQKTVFIFHKPGCPYCRTMEPIDEKLFQEFSNTIRFLKVNFDVPRSSERYDLLKQTYGIDTFPTYFFYDNGMEITSLRSKSMSENDFKSKLTSFSSLSS